MLTNPKIYHKFIQVVSSDAVKTDKVSVSLNTSHEKSRTAQVAVKCRICVSNWPNGQVAGAKLSDIMKKVYDPASNEVRTERMPPPQRRPLRARKRRASSAPQPATSARRRWPSQTLRLAKVALRPFVTSLYWIKERRLRYPRLPDAMKEVSSRTSPQLRRVI